MDKYQKIIVSVKNRFEKDKNSIALFVIGSVSRRDFATGSDLDLQVIIREGEASLEEFEEDGILIEIHRDTIQRINEKLEEKPMNAYKWLEAEPIFQKENFLVDLQEKAKQILENYEPKTKGLEKWLRSVKLKISAARQQNDELMVGFQIANVLWKIVEGIYAVNSLPVPPSTKAFKMLNSLENLPEDFGQLWEKTLTGNLKEREESTIYLIDFILNNLKIPKLRN